MKQIRIFYVILLFSSIILTACTSSQFYDEFEVEELIKEAKDEAYSRAYEDAYEEVYPEAFAEGYAEGEADGYDQGYDHGTEAAWEDANVEEIEEYYENLCDKYGYLTFDMLYYPHLLSNYIVENSAVYHTDWCCVNFDHNANYICTTDDSIPTSYTQCTSCANSKTYYYLDENTGIFHLSNFHLDLRTDDFITPTVTYRLVSYDAAIAQGYAPCPECGVHPN